MMMMMMRAPIGNRYLGIKGQVTDDVTWPERSEGRDLNTLRGHLEKCWR